MFLAQPYAHESVTADQPPKPAVSRKRIHAAGPFTRDGESMALEHLAHFFSAEQPEHGDIHVIEDEVVDGTTLPQQPMHPLELDEPAHVSQHPYRQLGQRTREAIE